MVCAMLTYIFPLQSNALKLAYCTALATKLSDTFGSEVGKAYGKTTYLITTLQLVPKGTEGAVSLEGTLAGIFGSYLILKLATVLNLMNGSKSLLIGIIAAFIATTIESYIGAIFQDKYSWLTNETVNFIMTIIGALIAFFTIRMIGF